MSAATQQDLLLFLSVERVRFPAKGRQGGGDGAPGRMRLDDGPDLPGKAEVLIPAGARLIFETPGGGGFGPPADRAAEAVAADVEAGLVSPEAARDIYGAGS